MYENEQWRPVVGWESIYEVSDHGRVRRIKSASGTQAGRILKCPAGKRGYPVAGLFNGERRHVGAYVHALVAAAFIGPRPAGLFVNHIDHDRTNNRVSNLEYVTPEGNTQHAKRADRLRGGGPVGEAAPQAKLTVEAVRSIRERHACGAASLTEMAKEYGVTRQAIFRVVRGLCWKQEVAA